MPAGPHPSQNRSTTVSSPPRSRGAYGFTLRGVDAAHDLLVPAPAAWPPFALAWRKDEGLHRPYDIVGSERAAVTLTSGGWVEIEREPARATFATADRPPDGNLVHPHFAGVAAVASRWLGRESFHAGAVVVDGGAWALLGDREAGKSSTLAWLAREGHPIVSDDLLVIDGPNVLAGPRSLDLRESAARRLDAGVALGRVGLRDRWRIQLDPVHPAVALRGWIVLTWRDGEPELVPVRGAERLRAIAAHRAVQMLPSDPAVLVELSALPCYELRRPREWASLGDAARVLVDALRTS